MVCGGDGHDHKIPSFSESLLAFWQHMHFAGEGTLAQGVGHTWPNNFTGFLEQLSAQSDDGCEPRSASSSAAEARAGVPCYDACVFAARRARGWCDGYESSDWRYREALRAVLSGTRFASFCRLLTHRGPRHCGTMSSRAPRCSDLGPAAKAQARLVGRVVWLQAFRTALHAEREQSTLGFPNRFSAAARPSSYEVPRPDCPAPLMGVGSRPVQQTPAVFSAAAGAPSGSAATLLMPSRRQPRAPTDLCPNRPGAPRLVVLALGRS